MAESSAWITNFRKTFALTERALRVDVRTTNSHLMRLAFCVLILLQLFFMQQTSAFGAPGLSLFSWLIYSNTVLATIVVPSMFGNAITEEKEERTLALLLVADVRPLTILAGKTLPRLMILLLVLLAQFPFALLAITLGGVSFHQITAAYVAVAAYLLFIASWGILCSVPFRKSANATGAAGLLILGYHVIPWLLIGLAMVVQGNPFFTPIWKQTALTVKELAEGVNVVNIFIRLRAILQAGVQEPIWTLQVGTNLALAALAFGLAWGTFGYFNRDLDSESVPSRKGRSRTGRVRRAWDNALAGKEFQFAAGGRTYIIGKVIAYSTLVGIVIYSSRIGNRGQIHLRDVGTILSAIFWNLLLPIEVTLTIARLLHSEAKEKTLSTLMLLPISTRRMLFEKFKGGMLAVIPVMLFGLASLLIWPELLPRLLSDIGREPFIAAGIAVLAVVNIVMFWQITLVFSMTMHPFVAIFAAYAIQYYGSLMVYGPIAYVVYQLFPSEEITTYIVGTLNFAVTTTLVVLMYFGIPRQIEETATKS